MSEKTDFHVDISKFPRGEFLFSTWGRKNSSEESNETSEEFFDAHVENKKYPRGDLRFPTWIFEKGGSRRYRSGRSVSELSELSEGVRAIRASVKPLQRITRQGAVHHLFLYLCATTLLYK